VLLAFPYNINPHWCNL